MKKLSAGIAPENDHSTWGCGTLPISQASGFRRGPVQEAFPGGAEALVSSLYFLQRQADKLNTPSQPNWSQLDALRRNNFPFAIGGRQKKL